MADAWSWGGLPGWTRSGDDAGLLTLDRAFNADRLHDLRQAVLAEAVAAGMPDERAAEVMLAVHELAANVVRHGGGAGRLRMRIVGGELHCQVTDPGPAGADGHHPQAGAEADADATPAWPSLPGHGLWLVHSLADHVTVASSLHGSQVIAVFALPRYPGDTAGQ